MKNIVLARIDDRLIHGQVVVSWLRHVEANEIIVIDDELAEDDFLREIVKSAAPDTIKVNVFTQKKGVEYLNDTNESERIIVLSKTPKIFQYLIEQGIKIPSVNLGGIGSSKDRKRIFKSISLNEEEINCLKKIEELGISVIIKILPNDKTVRLCEVL